MIPEALGVAQLRTGQANALCGERFAAIATAPFAER